MMIDRSRLNTLRADVGEEAFADLAFIFVAEMGGKLGTLRDDPTVATADDFHFLRGGAANLGFTGMVAACQAAETACRDGRAPDIGAVVAAFDAALTAAAPDLPGIVDAA